MGIVCELYALRCLPELVLDIFQQGGIFWLVDDLLSQNLVLFRQNSSNAGNILGQALLRHTLQYSLVVFVLARLHSNIEPMGP